MKITRWEPGEARAAKMGRSEGSSSPEPRPVVPRMMPLMYFLQRGSVVRNSISESMAGRGAVSGSAPKAYIRPADAALMVHSSVFILRAHVAESEAGRKSSQGFARLRIEIEMRWVVMKERMCGTEEYSGPIGRPRWEGGVEGLEAGVSEGRIIRRGGGGGRDGEGRGRLRS